jgi:hypothetical protein
MQGAHGSRYWCALSPDASRPYLGPMSGNMIVKTTTWYQWEMNINDVSDKAVLKAGWTNFTIITI